MRASASKVGLLSYCQAFAQPKMKWDTRSSDAADRGTRFHKAIALYIACEPGVPLKVEDDIAAEFEQAKRWVDDLSAPKGSLKVELALAWDPTTDAADVLDVVDRAYAPSSRLCGTADLVMLFMHDGKPMSAIVWDWKTGDASQSGPQLRILGLMVARAFGVESVTVAALEVRASGVTETCREDLDSFALSCIAGETAELVDAIPTAEPVPGSHCGELYCPARLSCPVGNEATAQIIPAEALAAPRRFSLADPITTAEHAAWAVDVCRLVSAKLDAIKDDIKAKCPKDGWKLDDGRVLREGHCEKNGFDKFKALALCKQLGATEEQIASLNYTFEASTGLRVSGGAAKPRAKRSKAA